MSIFGVEEIVITDATSAPLDITVDVTEVVTEVNVEVPGVQGPPGLQNVFVGTAAEVAALGWGPEEADHIWIEVNV